MQLVRLIPLVRELRPQIIHFHSALPHGEVISGIRALRRLLGDPCIFATPHTAARANYPKRRARLGLRAADIIVTPSSWSAEQAIKAGARPASTRVVYAGIDLPKESRADQRSHNVLALGRLVKTKGISVLIDAFAEAAASRPDWRLEIGGAGAEEASLRAAAAAAACADRIDFLGYIRGETKSGALGRASIGAVPSFKESFGGTLLEFQAQGLACVASHVGGMVELACQGRAARSVPAGDAPALAKALGELMDDPSQRARLGEAAREFASGLNWSAAGDAYEALYREQLALR
jgi:glycosyltransferase involved in cell wall biosynthesis